MSLGLSATCPPPFSDIQGRKVWQTNINWLFWPVIFVPDHSEVHDSNHNMISWWIGMRTTNGKRQTFTCIFCYGKDFDILALRFALCLIPQLCNRKSCWWIFSHYLITFVRWEGNPAMIHPPTGHVFNIGISPSLYTRRFSSPATQAQEQTWLYRGWRTGKWWPFHYHSLKTYSQAVPGLARLSSRRWSSPAF